MYSKGEAGLLRREFWTRFGQHMQPLLSAEGGPVNWINYKTGEKGIAFKMDAGNKKASIAIELSQKDEGTRHLYFEQFVQLKAILRGILEEEWNWEMNSLDDLGKSIGRIYTELNNVNVYNKEDWPKLISFFKLRVIALDKFWADAKYSFEALR